MAIFAKMAHRIERRVEAKLESMTPPKGEHEKRVKMIETGYFLAGLVVMLLGMNLVPNGIAALLFMILVLGCLSDRVRSAVIPTLYVHLAPRMGWPTWSQGLEEDRRQREAEEAAAREAYASGLRQPTFMDRLLGKGQAMQPGPSAAVAAPTPALQAPAGDPVTAPAAVPAVTPESKDMALQAVRHWASLEPAKRTSWTLKVADLCKRAALSPGLAMLDAMAGEEQVEVANTLLAQIARQNGIALAGGGNWLS